MEYKVILETIAGSHLYGTNHANSDIDIRGIAIEPINCIIGLEKFEQYEHPVEDYVVWGLKKFVNLALNNNPNVLDILFAPPNKWRLANSTYWYPIYDIRHEFLSKGVQKTFTGYAYGQLQKLKNGRSNRELLVAMHGYDTKDACHLIRLLFKAGEILTTGDYNPELSYGDLSFCKDVLNGKYELLYLVTLAEELLELTKEIVTELPDKPNRTLVENVVMNTYKDYLRG